MLGTEAKGFLLSVFFFLSVFGFGKAGVMLSHGQSPLRQLTPVVTSEKERLDSLFNSWGLIESCVTRPFDDICSAIGSEMVAQQAEAEHTHI